ncbi:DUF805 domain-containing protein [Arthrobacter sp. H20]|uniref:DUF805 domain-containing protein n=1 Tax=Arthrobacter sp. H20 TaxID=1267981 RepID=UPI0004B84B9C|nr:DUF805 domain-containing protein [Arthrobacter sp. H20]
MPSIALTIRRLHDANESGWLLLVIWVPVAGPPVLIFLMLPGPNPEGQRFDQPHPRPEN